MKVTPIDEIKITSPFGPRIHPITKKRTMHYGVDLRAAQGTPVYAVDDGKVWVSKYNKTAGEYITIRHYNGQYYSYYCHLERRLVQTGQDVTNGQLIGYSGSTGASTGPHLHFGLCTNYIPSAINSSQWMDPTSELKKAMMKLKKLPVKVNGAQKTINNVIEYKDENYVRLRDLVPLLGIQVDWSAKDGVTIKVI